MDKTVKSCLVSLAIAAVVFTIGILGLLEFTGDTTIIPTTLGSGAEG
jgi:hypothetical protein